jgi:protein transport protein HofQ/type IV pilus assembly protein PilQ
MGNKSQYLTSNFQIVNKFQNQSTKAIGFYLLELVIVLFLEVGCLLLDVAPATASQLIRRIDFEDAPVTDIIQTLAKGAGFDVVIAGDQAAALAKKATVHLTEIEPEQAIEHILRTNGFNYERSGAVLLVSALPQDQAQTAYRSSVAVVQLKYLGAAKAAELLAKLLPTAAYQVGGRANTLIIRGKEGEIAEVKEALAKIDDQIPQIMIESKVMELSQNDSLKLGLSYGNGTYKMVTSKNTRLTRPADDLISTLNALAANGKARVVACPRIATLDNQEALINIGNRIPYAVPVTGGGVTTQWTVNYIDAGVKLKITPQLGGEGDILTLVQPEVSTISEWRTTAAGDFPVISTRNAASIVSVKDGETIVIGGLLSETERENISRVPLLGYLPIIGLLFQNKNIEKEKTEIVFLITPHLI